VPAAGGAIQYAAVVKLLDALTGKALDVIKTENLYTLDGERGYSLGQDE